jgi:hypothetical protein
VNKNALWCHEATGAILSSPNITIFPPKTRWWRWSPVWNWRHRCHCHACAGTRGGRGLPYLVVLKYSIIRTKFNFNLFTPFTLFSFSTHCSDQTTIVNNNFCPLNILKSTKMKYYLIYFITYRIIALRRTSGKSEVVWATELYTYSRVLEGPS